MTPLEMIYWLLPVALFWPLAAMYVGGAPRRLEGGGAIGQSLGVLLAFVLSVLGWRLLRGLLDGITIGFAAALISTVITAALVPLLCKLSLRIFGVRFAPEHGGHGHGGDEAHGTA